jgi:hypothetical protein
MAKKPATKKTLGKKCAKKCVKKCDAKEKTVEIQPLTWRQKLYNYFFKTN